VPDIATTNPDGDTGDGQIEPEVARACHLRLRRKEGKSD
jgi:hypothetical protein